MDNIHNSIGPAVGSSRGKKNHTFLPAFLGKNYLTKFILVQKQFQKSKICLFNLVRLKNLQKQFQNSTFCIFIVLMGILILLPNSVGFQTRKNPGWSGKCENSYLSKFSSEKTANSEKIWNSKKFRRVDQFKNSLPLKEKKIFLFSPFQKIQFF